MRHFAILAALAVSACTASTTAERPEKTLPELAVERRGEGATSVIFVHGNGNASMADWQSVAPAVAELGTATLVYDRAGHGRSPLFQRPYRLDDEVESLIALTKDAAKRGPVIVVGHSFGGIVSALAASKSDTIDGMVFVDAPLPGFFTEEMAERERERYRPQFAMLRERAPDLAEAIIPRLEAFPQIAREHMGAAYPADLPTVVIKADVSAYEDPRSIAAEERGVAAFVAASPWRHLMRAEGSSHQVMRDRPDVVIAAVEYLKHVTERE